MSHILTANISLQNLSEEWNQRNDNKLTHKIIIYTRVCDIGKMPLDFCRWFCHLLLNFCVCLTLNVSVCKHVSKSACLCVCMCKGMHVCVCTNIVCFHGKGMVVFNAKTADGQEYSTDNLQFGDADEPLRPGHAQRPAHSAHCGHVSRPPGTPCAEMAIYSHLKPAALQYTHLQNILLQYTHLQ